VLKELTETASIIFKGRRSRRSSTNNSAHLPSMSGFSQAPAASRFAPGRSRGVTLLRWTVAGRGWGRGLHGLNERSASLMRREKQLGKGIGPREATPTRKMRSNGS
jgi:hypothetical protein